MKKLNLIIEYTPSNEDMQAASQNIDPAFSFNRQRSIQNFPELGMATFDEDFGLVPIPSPTLDAEISFAFSSDAPELEFDNVIARAQIEEEDLEAFVSQAEESGVEVFSDPQIIPFAGNVSHPKGPLGTARSVRSKLNIPALGAKGFDGRDVAIAIVDSGINLQHLQSQGVAAKLDPSLSWSPYPSSPPPGHWSVDHGTMCAYDALIAAPQATLLDFPILQSKRSGGSVMSGYLSEAIAAFSVLLSEMSKPINRRAYNGIVVNNSWGMYNTGWDFPPGHSGRYADNSNHPFFRQVSSLSRAGADVLFAAGNCGISCPDGRCKNKQSSIIETNIITGANGHPDVLSIGGVDVYDDRLCYSSEGPSALGLEKPDLCAYTHFLGSRAYGHRAEDSGTSAACPVMAGVIAALRSGFPAHNVTSSRMRDVARLSANSFAPASNWVAGFGHGIVDAVGMAQMLP